MPTALIAATLATFALLGCGGGDGESERFEREGYPFTFEYPGELELTEDLEFAQQLGGAAEDTVALTHDEDNALIIQRFTLAIEIDEDNLSLARREIDSLLQQVDPDAEAEEGEIAGLAALTYEQIELSEPEEATSRYVVLFEGDQQYVLNCQSTPEGREEIEAACDEALETLEAEAGRS